tara:strand:- start:64429 stop:64734 length:306 start_codon:yes stop_codon:yes gene_type:complete
MRRKLKLRYQKKRYLNHLKLKADLAPSLFNPSEITYASITQVKRKGQYYHQQRLYLEQKMNARQLKKHRKKRLKSGAISSRFTAICKLPLKPASAKYLKIG